MSNTKPNGRLIAYSVTYAPKGVKGGPYAAYVLLSLKAHSLSIAKKFPIHENSEHAREKARTLAKRLSKIPGNKARVIRVIRALTWVHVVAIDTDLSHTTCWAGWAKDFYNLNRWRCEECNGHIDPKDPESFDLRPVPKNAIPPDERVKIKAPKINPVIKNDTEFHLIKPRFTICCSGTGNGPFPLTNERGAPYGDSVTYDKSKAFEWDAYSDAEDALGSWPAKMWPNAEVYQVIELRRS